MCVYMFVYIHMCLCTWTGADYGQISEETWQYLLGIYSGGPEIAVRQAISSPETDTHGERKIEAETRALWASKTSVPVGLQNAFIFTYGLLIGISGQNATREHPLKQWFSTRGGRSEERRKLFSRKNRDNALFGHWVYCIAFHLSGRINMEKSCLIENKKCSAFLCRSGGGAY